MPMNAARRSTMIDRSKRTAPIVSWGMIRRSNFTGGSVTVMMTSRTTTMKPRGRQSRLNDRTNSTTTRAMSRSQNANSTKPRIEKNRDNCATSLQAVVTLGKAGMRAGRDSIHRQPTRPPVHRRGAAGRSLVGVEAGLRDALALVGRDVHVGRGEKEDLRGDLVERPPQGECQAGGEVDETLGVGVVHRDQIHDHGRAIAKALADGAGLAVILRTQRGDLRQGAACLEEFGHSARLHRNGAVGGATQRIEARAFEVAPSAE